MTRTSAAMPVALGGQRQRARGGGEVAAAVVDHGDLHGCRLPAARSRPAGPSSRAKAASGVGAPPRHARAGSRAAPATSARRSWPDRPSSPGQRRQSARHRRRRARQGSDQHGAAQRQRGRRSRRVRGQPERAEDQRAPGKPLAHQHRRRRRAATDGPSQTLTAPPWWTGSRRRRAGRARQPCAAPARSP